MARLAGATTVIAHSFSTLVQEVEVIAVGTVTAIETEWDAQQGAPFTLVTFSELTVLKGEGGQAALTLHFLGGPTPDGHILQIAGAPQFHLGDRRVIFCVGNQQNAVPLVGMWQGVYRVVFDAARGIEVVHNHAGQPVTTLPTGGGWAPARWHHPSPGSARAAVCGDVAGHLYPKDCTGVTPW